MDGNPCHLSIPELTFNGPLNVVYFRITVSLEDEIPIDKFGLSNLKFGKTDVSRCPDVAKKFVISDASTSKQFPTLISVKNGEKLILDFDENLKRILKTTEVTKERGATFSSSSELKTCGYTCGEGLDGIEIIVNSFGSYTELRKVYVIVDLIKSTTMKSGGYYLYSNLRGRDGRYLEDLRNHHNNMRSRTEIIHVSPKYPSVRIRMTLFYLSVQLMLCVRGKFERLLVLESYNVYEALRGYMTKYNYSSTNTNLNGKKISNAASTVELALLQEGKLIQTDEEDTSTTYNELSTLDQFRKQKCCGLYSMIKDDPLNSALPILISANFNVASRSKALIITIEGIAVKLKCYAGGYPAPDNYILETRYYIIVLPNGHATH
ncbi:hypothetical protein PGB90_003248 [Kerria lacca]